MAETRSSQIRSINAEGAKRKAEARLKFNQATKDITRIWKEGYGRLKQENDDYQLRRNVEYKNEMAEIDEWIDAQISQIGR